MDETILINSNDINKLYNKEILEEIIKDMEEKGYNPYKQITEYILTGEVGYITSFNDARNKISKLDRRDLVESMLKEFTK